MKVKLLVILFFTIGFAKAQDATGVKFEHGLSWTQVQEKAKKENKYIFLDVYTTWCGPCKLMDRDVFPQEKVGEFFNTHFINVKIQADTTGKDSEEVKKWYNDAQAIATTYNINSFPTFLFFNPKGELVHRLNGGSPTGDDFIAKAEAALSGYHKQKRQFQSGKKDPEFLLELIKSAQLMNDRELMPLVMNEYLATQKNLLTEENLKLIAESTKKVADPGFAVLRNNADKADLVLGKGVSERIVKTVVFDDIVFQYLKVDGVKKEYGGGMVEYIGKINENVDWDEIEKELNLEFPDLSEEIIMTSKPMYYQWLKNWPEYVGHVHSHRNKIDKFLLLRYANNVFLFSDDSVSLRKALDWSRELLVGENKKSPRFLLNYANLLYKTGKKEEAIKVMEEAVALSGQEGGHFAEALDKMKNGKKTW
ncbi:thioredoxin fold domain-containing protein [Pontibacter pamirensis]|uniref:thioredoxin fold domain-containing protein n=1 Tax=Pontibacter pamirensis TaxID=2562824 RepID=UPI00138993A9|nr:thioredoxin fold domain-containing protein [Pontibacter pamirensis]